MGSNRKRDIPQLNEVFLVGIPAINRPEPGHRSALGRVFEAPMTAPMAKPAASQPKPAAAIGAKKLKPELEKVVEEYSVLLRHIKSTEEAKMFLREFSHEMEKAEGEDPAELDPNGPPAGSTGGQ